jgi:hypothetical protein
MPMLFAAIRLSSILNSLSGVNSLELNAVFIFLTISLACGLSLATIMGVPLLLRTPTSQSIYSAELL